MTPLFRPLLACATAIALLLPAAARAETIDAALGRLLSVNHALTASTHEIYATDAEVVAAYGALEPQVTVSGKAGPEWFRTTDPDPGDPNSDTHITGSISADVDYALYDAGLREAKIDEASAIHVVTELDRESRAQALLLDGITAYCQVLSSQTLADIADSQYKLAGSQLSFERARSAKGEGTAVEVSYASQRRQQVARRKAEQDGQRRAALLAYANLFQLPPDEKRMTMPEPPAAAMPKSLEEARRAAIAEHPDLRSASADVKRTVARIHGAEAADAPKLSVYSNIGHDANVSGTSDDETRAGAGLRFSWTLYDGDTNNSLVRAARERSAAARARAGETHDALVGRVDKAWVDWETSAERLSLAREGVKSVKALVGQRRRQQTEGKESEGAVLDARGQLAAAEFELAAAEAERRLAAFRLLGATGRLTPQSFGLALADPHPDTSSPGAKH